MTEQEYIKLTKRVKLNSALQLLGDLSSYTSLEEDTSNLIGGIELLRTYLLSIDIDIECES